MVSKAAIVGIIILIIGLIVGAYAAYTPVAASTSGHYNLLNTSLHIDPNDYQSENYQLAKGQTVNVAVSLSNQTVLFVYIMNQTQYYNFYGCAPWCRGAPANSTASNNAGNNATTALATTPLAFFQNISTVTPSSSFKGNFTAPSNGTYYFVFDNSMGPNYATYYAQNASGFTTGTFNLVSYGTTTTNAVNWVFLGVGVVLLIVGGAIATVAWDSKKPVRKTPPVTTTSTPPPTSPPPPTTTS